jgi:hypothetical protein
MKKFTLCLLTITLSFFLQAQDTIKVDFAGTPNPSFHYFNFEDNSSNNYFYADSTQANNLWEIGDPIKTNFTSGISSYRALVTDTVNPYPINNTSSLYMNLYHSGLGWLEIMFWYKIDSDTITDGGTIEFSFDNGLSWYNITETHPDPQIWWSANFSTGMNLTDTITSLGEPGISGTSDWEPGYVNIFNSVAGCCDPWTMKVRFSFASDNTMNNPKDGWILDNFSISAMMEGINNLNTSENISLFPNPSSNYISFENISESTTITLFNAAGEKTMETLVKENATIDVSRLTPGIYFAFCKNTKLHETKKIILK